MVRLLLLDFLLKKHPLHTHRCFDDALLRLDIELCNETRFQPWARIIVLIFILLIGIIKYYYV